MLGKPGYSSSHTAIYRPSKEAATKSSCETLLAPPIKRLVIGQRLDSRGKSKPSTALWDTEDDSGSEAKIILDIGIGVGEFGAEPIRLEDPDCKVP